MGDKQSFTQENVRAYMKSVRDEHIDHGEVNWTFLAEDAANHFDMADEGGPLDDETHWIWDLAQEVGEA